ncbi:hypothetical protein L7F22_061075 [Adiantum nelumboides]|nr:hypothetical protein [Adiantum nelumboides]
MHHYLIKCGWERLMADYNIYIWKTAKGMAILGLFVDDIPLLGTSEYMLLQAIDCISQEFLVTDKGPLIYFLGIEVIQDPAGKLIQLSQSKYIEELLLFYGMSASTPELTPLPVKHKLAPKFHAYTRTDALYCPSFHFPKFCGQLCYLISCTCIDLCYTGHILSCSMSKLCKVHKQAAKRTLHYLCTTQDYALTYYYDPSRPISISGYADVNWAGDDPICFSMGGYVFILAGGPIAWQTKQQSSIASSSTKAEYVVAALASCEALWISELITELKLPFNVSTASITLFCDNQSTIALAESPSFSSKLKHIKISFHFLKELAANGFIKLVYVPSGENWADFLTRSVPATKQTASSCGLSLISTG